MNGFSGSSRRKKKILDAFGQAKKGYFLFKLISSYHEQTQPEAKPEDDRLATDLDMDELFMYLDRTTSRVGQQALYARLRQVNTATTAFERQEALIDHFKANPQDQEGAILSLHQLSEPESYYIASLLKEEYLKEPGWFWVVKVLGYLAMASVLAIIIMPKLWLIVFAFLGVNLIIHYWNKRNLYEYAVSIPELIKLIKVARKLPQFGVVPTPTQAAAIDKLQGLSGSLQIFRLEKGIQSELSQFAELFIELIRAYFLIEPLSLYKALDKLEKHKPEISQVLRYVGDADISLSTMAIREQTEVWCKPHFVNTRQLQLQAVYHPLIINAVANTINLAEQSVFLTGSNMSGKSTFMRTIGVNALCAQTLNTSFSKQYSAPRFRLNSAMRIADDLMSDTSYFFQEVLAIKSMLVNENNADFNLFLLDELFKGTNTLERVASGRAILEYLHSPQNLVIIASHDMELAERLQPDYASFHFTEQIKDDQIHFDYLLKAGKLTNTNAISILEINGFPADVTQAARAFVSEARDTLGKK